MEVHSKIINTKFNEIKYDISWRDIMRYAAAIADSNPCYLDDEREGGIIAHPMFPVSLTMPIVENLANYVTEESVQDFQYDILMTSVHYSEYIKIHRLIYPNDHIIIGTRIVALLPHRAGTHIILCCEARDNFGKPVFTEYLGGMLRGVECVGGEKGRENLPEIPHLEQTGKILWKKDIFVDPLRAHIYDGCVGPNLPIHTSKEFAHSVGLPDILLQGVCTLAFAVREIISEELKGDPTNVTDIACNFTGMVIPNTKIRVDLIDRKIKKNYDELFFEVYNKDNKKALRKGFLRVKNS